jgi:hypothetical protein
MKFEIKHVEIIDYHDPAANLPQIAECHVEIGYPRSPGADIFFVDVGNELWAQEYLDTYGTPPHPTILVVERIDEKYIREKVEEMFLDCEYGSFEELVRRAAPLMRWEFA